MDLGATRKPRRPSLTPMIDVVFLLLVFFMLASRFGVDMHLPLVTASAGGSGYQGPPRLVDISAEGLSLNGVVVTETALPQSLAELMETPDDTVILRTEADTPLQRLVAIMSLLTDAGLKKLVLVE